MRALSVLLLASTVLLAISCEGEQGLTGPSGDDGNANVVTGTITPTNEEWLSFAYYWFSISPTYSQGYGTRYVDIPLAEITADVIATGAVLVSFQARSGYPNWTPLPFQFVPFSGDYIINIVYEVTEGNIRLHYFYMKNDAGVTTPDLGSAEIATYTFKYTVRGGTALEDMEVSGIDISDHEQILEYLAAP